MNRYSTHIVRTRVNIPRVARRGYTLVEVLVATTLTLIMMFAVVSIFAMLGETVSDSRALLEMNERLRAAKTRLQMDLEGITVLPVPPLGEAGHGYLEIIEGPVMAFDELQLRILAQLRGDEDEALQYYRQFLPARFATNTTDGVTGIEDTTVGDFDDIIMFTTRNTRLPFVDSDGNVGNVAEVSWFVYGNRLMRRVRVVPPAGSFGGLTLRNNRTRLTGRSDDGWVTPPSRDPLERDFWTAEANDNLDSGNFTIDFHDVILNNVIGFDVKVFDPVVPVLAADGTTVVGRGDYVDLGYANQLLVDADDEPISPFSHVGNIYSGLAACVDVTGNGTCDTCSALGRTPCIGRPQRVYDTWTTWYAAWPDTTDPAYDPDDPANWEPTGIPPPYRVPLRGIQVKIRVFEPDSRMIREVTVVQDFLPR